MITLKQHELIDKISKAHELQETLKKERQHLKLHELMDEIIDNKVKHIGKYEIIDKVVQKKRYTISAKLALPCCTKRLHLRFILMATP
jgi:hypothetical protein